MSFVLDTHSFIWAVLSPEKLPVRVVQILEDRSLVVQVSAISFWQISLKHSVGKLELEGVTPDEFPSLAELTGFRLLPMEPSDLATSWQLPWLGNHKDPFDRMLIWQAIRSKTTLVAKDAAFGQYTAVGLDLLWK